MLPICRSRRPTIRPPPMPPAIYNWTGFYLGGNVGAGLLSDNITPTDTADRGCSRRHRRYHPSIRRSRRRRPGRRRLPILVRGWSALEGVIERLRSSTVQNTQTRRGRRYARSAMTSEPNGLPPRPGASATPPTTLLFYVKGGGAWMHVELHPGHSDRPASPPPRNPSATPAPASPPASASNTAMTENLSARLEYDFYDFGTKTYNFNLRSQTPRRRSAPICTR